MDILSVFDLLLFPKGNVTCIIIIFVMTYCHNTNTQFAFDKSMKIDSAQKLQTLSMVSE